MEGRVLIIIDTQIFRTGLIAINIDSTLTFPRPGYEGIIPDVTFAMMFLVSSVQGAGRFAASAFPSR